MYVRLTKEGHELTMASNYIGHFVLSNLLLSQLEDKADGRIVNVASCMHMVRIKYSCHGVFMYLYSLQNKIHAMI